MNIRQAIAWLSSLEEKHGPDVAVYFDCPNCLHSFTPNTVETAAVHLTAQPKADRAPQERKG